MFSEIDIPLSFRTTMKFSGLRCAMLFNASKLEPESWPHPHDRHCPRVRLAVRGGFGDAESDRKSGPGVAGTECVVEAFKGLPESGKAALETNVLEVVAPPGYQLVRIGLVGRVPDDAVLGAVEDAV